MRPHRWSALLTAVLAALALTWLTLGGAAQGALAAAAPQPANGSGIVQAGELTPAQLPDHRPPAPTPATPHYSPAPQRWVAPPSAKTTAAAAPNDLSAAAIGPAAGGEWDGQAVDYPRVISATGQYWMWYLGASNTNPGYGWALGLATSPDGWTWTKDAGNPVLGLGDPGAWDEMFRGQPAVLEDAGVFKMWYSGGGTGVWQTGYATSTNGVDWDVYGGNPVLPAGGGGAWDEGEADGPSVLYDGGQYKMWYHGANADYSQFAIGYATSPDGLTWTKHPGNPVLTGTVGEWDEGFVAFPQVIKTGGTYELWYYANGQIGYATSPDGLVWTKSGANPVLTTGWDGDLRGFDVWRAGSLYQLWFTNVKDGARLIGYAESADGVSWTMPVSNPVLSPGAAGVLLNVNYAHDWVIAATAPGAAVAITVSDGSGVKATVSGLADSYGEFRSWDGMWDPTQPDLLPGDAVTATASGAETTVNPIGTVDGVLDADADRFTGTVDAGWFAPLSLTIRCEVWVDNGPPPVYAYNVPADGGSFVCDFAGVWDLERGQDVAVRYEEPDGDGVISVFRQYPLDLDLQVNVGHDWVEGNYEPGHTLYLTVTDGLGQLKTTATLTTGVIPWWGSNNSGFSTNLPPVAGWLPAPDLQAGDWVYARMDNGYTATVRLGDIAGAVDTDADTVAGTVSAAWLSFPLDLRCEVWEPGGPGYDLSVAANGGAYLCDTTADWDLAPGHNVAVSYDESDGDRVINMFRAPVPHVRLELWPDGAPAVGGNFVLNVRYYNDGDAPAPDASIQATLTNAEYLGDTAPGGHTGSGTGPITWDLGELAPHSIGQFYLFVTVTGAEGDDLSAAAEIGTGSPYNEGDPGERAASWIGGIVANDTQLTLDQGVWTWEPFPGEDYVYELNVCNKGGTASSEVTVTDTLPLSTTLVSWAGRQPGWSALPSGPLGELVLTRPSVAGYLCSQVRVRVHLNPAATPETLLSNTASVAAANDLDLNDNTHTLDHHPGTARHNLWLNKNWGHGQLTPGGQANYWLDFGNNGNQAVTRTVRLTESIPAGLTFVSAVRVDWADIEAPVTPTLVTAEAVVFTFTDLPAGYSDAIRVRFAIGAVPSGTVVTNCATLADGSFEHNPYDDTACNTETVRAGPNLRVVKAGEWNGPNNLHYRVRLENVGSTLVTNVAVTDTYPAGLTLDNWNFGFWRQWEGLASGHQLTLTLSEMEPGWAVNLDLWLSGPPAAGALLTNTAQISLAPGDSHPADNTSSAVLGVGPDLAVDQWVSAGTPGVGQLLTLTLHFANQGAFDTVGAVRITETLPAGLAFVSAQKRFCDGAYFCAAPPDVVNGQTLAWNWNGPDPLGAGWWDDLRVTVRVTGTFALGTLFTPTAQIASLAPGVDVDPFPANNWAQTVINLPVVNFFIPLVTR